MRNALKTMKKQISDFCNFHFLRYGRFCTKNSRKFTKITVLLCFAPILLATRWKCVSEDYKRVKKSFAKKMLVGYHWLAFLNQVRKESKTQSSKVPNSLRILSTKSIKSQKLNVWKLILHITFQNIIHLLGQRNDQATFWW